MYLDCGGGTGSPAGNLEETGSVQDLFFFDVK